MPNVNIPPDKPPVKITRDVSGEHRDLPAIVDTFIQAGLGLAAAHEAKVVRISP